MKKCDSGPSGISDVTYCKWAFVDRQGNKVDVTDDVQKVLDGFMAQVAILKPWVKVRHDGRSPSAPQHGLVPYRFHIITVSPVVLLVVPRQPSDTDYCSGRWPEQGCIPSRRFDLEPYWYKKQPRAVEGSFWIAPALGVTSKAIEKCLYRGIHSSSRFTSSFAAEGRLLDNQSRSVSRPWVMIEWALPCNAHGPRAKGPREAGDFERWTS